uniref:Flp pilus assembly protein CpaB n=1 Tax=uncultured Erythrobacter sp. TaxID=263913 RepID=UPI00261E0E1E|nr:Flp pilus assembly protein CpaB [uncultured Erythrobacter sp.]
MRGRNLLIIGGAIALGLVAVFLLNSYFSGYEQQQEQAAQSEQLSRIVVATQPIAFGTPITSTNTRLANWPSNAVPEGAFGTIEAATQGGRVALRPLVAGEPVLANKVSGEGGRASLAAALPDDLRAVSIPVNAIAGVGGFVRAGDVVDVMLTRQIPGEGATPTDKMTTVVLENVQVLATDQSANDNETAAAVATTATLQTDLIGSQKLALATQIGTLSLTLRNVENQIVGGTRAVVPRDLGGAGIYIPARGTRRAPAPSSRSAPQRGSNSTSSAPRRPSGPSMTVVRGTEAQDYRVNRNGN